MVECMYTTESARHTKVVRTTEAMHAAHAVHAAVHPPEAVASDAAHRVGGQRWHGKHRHYDSTSDR
jgi:hypothetical protein